ncbi:MAG: [LysW]-aminoadipate kinase [Planctomycetota bacterium]
MLQSELDPSPSTVLKLGGAAGVDHATALDDVAERVARGDRIAIVHGGSDEANRLGDAVGHPARTLRSPSGHESRHTDPRTLELFVMATALVNRRIVGALQARGVDAVGLSGLDGATLLGARKDAVRTVEGGRVRIVRDDWSGRIREVRADLASDLLDSGRVPVLAPVAMTERGEPLNVDGDRAAATLAGALGAGALVLLTAVPGLLRAFPDPSTRIDSATEDEIVALEEVAQGRMKRKVVAAREALRAGVARVVIAASDAERPLTAALDGEGTTILGRTLAADEAAAEVTP